MKHLCIINPKAGLVSGHVDEFVDEIKDFFARNPRMDYAFHVTRWKRDASGFSMRYVKNASEIVRIYIFGGGGTLFEVINGVVGLPNVQVAYYPLGKDNDLLTVFGKDSYSAFRSMRNLSLSPAIPVDTILAGNHYFISNVHIGIGAFSFLLGEKLSKQFRLPIVFCYISAAFYYAFLKKTIRFYHIEMDNTELNDYYIGIFIANIPGTGIGVNAPEAQFNDGYMDMYVILPTPRNLVLKVLMGFQNCEYDKWPDYIHHYRCKKVKIVSPSDMTMIFDGEVFYNKELLFEIKPSSVNLVCPMDIDRIAVLPSPSDSVPQEEFSLQDFMANGGES